MELKEHSGGHTTSDTDNEKKKARIAKSFLNEQLVSQVDTNSKAEAEMDTNPFSDGYRSETRDNALLSEESLTLPLEQLPFKTLNRILDDIRFTIPFKLFKERGPDSLLNSKPIDYSTELARVAGSGNLRARYDMIILNNHLNYAPSAVQLSVGDGQQVLTIVRGLLVNLDDISHFRLAILEDNTSNVTTTVIDKHEYHVVPSSLLAAKKPNTFNTLNKYTGVPNDATNILDDAFFVSPTGQRNHTLRVTIFSAEFDTQDLEPLYNPSLIRQRYLKTIESNPNSNLSDDMTPTSDHCFKTLIKVLKGPIQLPAGETIKTINSKNISLNTLLEIQLLFDKLAFTMKDEELIPPDLKTNRYLLESYIRKILEIIYVARRKGPSTNQFNVVYSYDDSLSLVYRTFNEFDKHLCQTYSRTHKSNELPFLVNLSVCTFFQDELTIRCFENTVKSDPANKLHYVDSLKNVIKYKSNQASNGKLRTYYANASQKGDLIGASDYEAALKALDIDISNVDPTQLDDDYLIAMYQTAFNNDPRNYVYLNRLFKLIAKVRNSDVLDDYLKKEVIPVNLAIEELGIEEITEDEVVITAYEFKLDDILTSNGFNADAGEVQYLNKSLLSVALFRKSYLLLNYIELKLPDYMALDETYSYTDALKKLESTESTSDFEIISKFQEKAMSTTDTYEVKVLRHCLRVVVGRRDSKVLLSFLSSGKVDASLLPADNWPAGLDNIGNTCYLNSLLQYYFCIKPLRELVLNFDERKVNRSKQRFRKIGGRDVEDAEILRSNQFIYHLRNLFEEMITTTKRCVQPSKDLAYLSFLPLSQPVEFKYPETHNLIELDSDDDNSIKANYDENTDRRIYPNPFKLSESVRLLSHSTADTLEDSDAKKCEHESPVSASSYALRSNDVEMTDLEVLKGKNQSNSSSVEEIEAPGKVARNQTFATDDRPQILPISTDQMESTIELGRQQDVTECIENVTFQIETVLEPEYLEEDNEQYDIIKKLFYGMTKQVIQPLDSNVQPRVSTERFFSLIINISDHPRDIYDSLDNYFSEDVVKLEEGYVKKTLTISKLPDILQFHVQRVLFDREKLMAYKSLEQIPFDETIYLDRYLDTNDPEILHKRNQLFQWKSEIAELRRRRDEILRVNESTNLTIIDSLIATKKFLQSSLFEDKTLSVQPSTIQTIDEEIANLRDQLQQISSRLNTLDKLVVNQFTSYKKVGYSIFAVFIHRGEASYGHYWVYIKDPQKNIFRKYNDEIVSEVPLSEVINFTSENTATPYYIVYVKDALQQDYIQPLKRIIDK